MIGVHNHLAASRSTAACLKIFSSGCTPGRQEVAVWSHHAQIDFRDDN